VERAAVFAKVYSKKDGTPISDGVRDKIVSQIIVGGLYVLFFVRDMFIANNMCFGSCVKTG
jgi:hypothetical protein